MPENEPKEINIRSDIPSLRPEALTGFFGQSDIKRRVSITLTAAKSRNEPLPHILLAGPPGLGKTTLAGILAKEMGAAIHVTSGPSLEKPADLAGTLVNLQAGDILFIDEIHRLSAQIEEFLYPAMEDRKLDILIENGAQTKSMRIDLAAFTLIGATTKPGNLTAPLRSRFQTIHRLELYTELELAEIVLASARRINCKIEQDACEIIAKRSRGTPRTANNNLLWVRDYTTAEKRLDEITAISAQEALDDIGIDESGLDPTDRKILNTLCKEFEGGPVGISNLALATGEDSGSIEDIHEPYLVANGFVRRTPQGRTATEKTWKTLKLTPKRQQGALL